jgi:hypothetical protein
LWEIWTRGIPWDEIECGAVDFADKLTAHVTAGDRPRLPDGCEAAPLGYSELMAQCWTDKPAERPRFDEIMRVIDARLASFDKRTSRDSTNESVL